MNSISQYVQAPLPDCISVRPIALIPTTLTPQLSGVQLTTVEEQRERQEHVLRLLARERKQAEEIARLEGELAKAYEERDTEIEKRDKVLTL